MTGIQKDKLEAALAECASHVKRIRYSRNKLDFFPVSAAQLAAMNDEEIETIDSFVYRFTKLQDSMGQRVYPLIYFLYEGEQEPRPFLDKLHRLEKLEVIKSVEEWQWFRELRNNLSHEYPNRREEMAQNLNLLHMRIDDFLSLCQKGLERLTDLIDGEERNR